jgi:hypothetical protein
MSPQLFLIGLWRHECERTFMDKLTNNQDKKVLTDILNKTTKEKFRESLGFDDDQLMTNMIFCDFQRKDIYDEYGELVSVAPFVYEACPDLDSCRKLVNTKLDGYNEKFPSKTMPLVIFVPFDQGLQNHQHCWWQRSPRRCRRFRKAVHHQAVIIHLQTDLLPGHSQQAVR